jgi:hypothetical protein
MEKMLCTNEVNELLQMFKELIPILQNIFKN